MMTVRHAARTQIVIATVGFFGCALFSLSPRVWALEADEVDVARQRELLGQCARAKSSKDSAILRAKLFEYASDLPAIAYGDDVALAVDAYWRLYREPCVRSIARGWLSGIPGHTERSADRLAGYLEGKFGVVVPDWWVQVLISGRNLPENSDWQKIAALGIRAKQDVVEAAGEAGAKIHINDETVILPDAVVTRIIGERPGNWEVYGDERHVFIAAYQRVPKKYRLYSFDRAANDILWDADVWSLGVENLGGISGSWWQSVEIQIRGNQVYVFGSGPGGVYLEAFRIDDGTAVLRFATNNWNVREPK
jgi:hypothetical protein